MSRNNNIVYQCELFFWQAMSVCDMKQKLEDISPSFTVKFMKRYRDSYHNIFIEFQSHQFLYLILIFYFLFEKPVIVNGSLCHSIS